MKQHHPYWHPLFKHLILGGFALLVTMVSPLTYALSSELLSSQVLHVNCNGNFEDQSTLKHTIDNQGVTLTPDKFGYSNQACSFNGSAYLKIPNNPAFNLSDMTISAWVFVPTSVSIGDDRRAIVSNYAGAGNAQHYGIHIEDNVAQAFYDDGNEMKGAKDTNDATSLVDGMWHHVAAVFEGGGKTRLYVDGEFKRQSSGIMPTSIIPTGDLYIGRGGVHEGIEERWIGSIDDIRILNTALTDEEITLLSATIDLPTGQTFTLTSDSENAPFLLDNAYVDDSFLVTPNNDGSFSINKSLANSSGTRSGNADSLDSATLNIKDGEMTLIDEATPGITARLNLFGDLEITDESIPDMKLTMPRGSNQFIFQSIAHPEITVESTGTGLIIRDSTNPDVTAIRHANGDIMVADKETGIAGYIDKNGNAVLKHPDFPTIEISLNVNDTGNDYVITDTETNECLEISTDADGNLRIGDLRFGFIKKAFNSVKNVVSKGVNKIKCFFKCNPVGNFISNVAGKAKGLVKKIPSALSKIGKFGKIISPIISIGSKILDKIFGNRKYKKAIKKLEGQIHGLKNQIHTLQATIQQQDADIAELKQKNATLEEAVINLQQIVAQQAAVIEQQAQTIAELKNTVEQQKQIIDIQAATIERLEQRIADLERNTRNGEGKVDDDIRDDGEQPTTRSSSQDLRSKVQNNCKSPVVPASCQVYGVQDEGLNDSVFFFFNPETQLVEQLGQTCSGCDIESMAIHPVTSEIYLGSGNDAQGHPNGHLYKLDAKTGQLQSVGNTGFDDISGLTFDDNGVLWGWAKSVGLITLDTVTGQGSLQLASAVELADLDWDNNYQVLYGVVGKELWLYDPATGDIAKQCNNLPNKTEAVKTLPLSLSPPGIVWVASHKNSQTELQAYEIDTCEALVGFNLSIGFDDVEGIATPVGACSQ